LSSPVRDQGAINVHHIGVACHDLEEERAQWLGLGFRIESDLFEDSVQGIRGQFMISGDTRIELLQDLAGSKTIAPWLKSGTKLYHIGFLVDNIVLEAERLNKLGAKTVRPPMASTYFDGRLICFLFDKNGTLIELIQSPTQP
jgi:methylmalonyl-CoA/ethylmalonyl-CoA epimerase